MGYLSAVSSTRSASESSRGDLGMFLLSSAARPFLDLSWTLYSITACVNQTAASHYNLTRVGVYVDILRC